MLEGPVKFLSVCQKYISRRFTVNRKSVTDLFPPARRPSPLIFFLGKISSFSMKDCSFKTRIFRNCLFLLNLISWDEIVWGSFYAHNFLKHFNTKLFCPGSPEWQITSSNKGTFVHSIRKVEPPKKTICCYKVNWFVVSVVHYNLPFSGWIFRLFSKSFVRLGRLYIV